MLRREVEGNKIKSRAESHSRGRPAPPPSLGRQQGAAAAGSEGPGHRRAHTAPGSLRSGRVTMVAGGGRGRRPRSYRGPPRAPSLPHIRGG